MAKRRGRNEGSLFVEKTTGRWVGEISLGFDPNTGKRIKQRVRGDSKGEVKKALDDLRQKTEYGVAPDRNDLSAHLDHWLENTIRPNRKVKTYEAYSDACRLDIKPVIGHVKMMDFRRTHVEQLLGTMSKKGRSASLRHRAFRTLSSALKSVKLPQDVFRGVEKPRVKRKRPEVGQDVWTVEQSRLFLKTCELHTHGPMFHLLFSTGLRIGEMLALHWDNVDLKAGVLHVRYTISETREFGTIRGETKTEAGNRSISLSNSEVGLFLRQKMRSKVGGQIVFASVNGTYQHTSNVRKKWNEIAEAAGLPHAVVHSSRHASASYMLAAGVDPVTVAKRLGHSRVSTTLDTYAHAIPQKDAEAAVKLEAILGGGL